MLYSSLKESIRKQREELTALLGNTMYDLAKQCALDMPDRHRLEARLSDSIPNIPFCKHLFVTDARARQIIDNITRDGLDDRHMARDRSTRPYMQNIVGTTDFKLSDAYISRNNKRPSLTAVQVMRDPEGMIIGFLGADYDLRELPGTQSLYQENHGWRQIKGDPAIRGGLFQQHRVESLLDSRIDDILALMTELMTENGVFHGKLHFSSSRASVWLVDDPYSYRILSFDDLIDPHVCLAYPHQPYTSRSVVPKEAVEKVFEMFKELRFADEVIYLRNASLNICNGLVSLNFSCDGSHYIGYEEFLNKGLDFWFGGAQ
ncbi:PDC sensor domain-containing protein [Magnetococcus sp. PR-3]|uniref:PDC sensor domain-containing protein n=1 Tax=Magnetococcus sp. PR-3 TaxID=3120355 RepID=UPI002FCE0C09